MDDLTNLHRQAIDNGHWAAAVAVQAEIAARDDELRRIWGGRPYSSADIRAELERVIG